MKYGRLSVIIPAVFLLVGCTCEAWLFPVSYFKNQQRIVKTVLDFYLEKEIELKAKFGVYDQSYYFIEQHVPFWHCGYPSQRFIDNLAQASNYHFGIRSVRDIEWREVSYSKQVLDQAPWFADLGKAAELIVIQKFVRENDNQAALLFQVKSGKINGIPYQATVEYATGGWKVTRLSIEPMESRDESDGKPFWRKILPIKCHHQ